MLALCNDRRIGPVLAASGQETLTLDHIKWALTLAISGYAPLGLSIGVLFRELLKSKSNEVETLRTILPLIDKLVDLKQDLVSVVDSLNRGTPR